MLGSENNEWYPYVELSENGTTVIFSPSSTEPKSQISAYNPYNLVDNSLPPPALEVKKYCDEERPHKIVSIKQLDRDRMILISDSNEIRVVQRNPDSQSMEFSQVFCQKGTIYNLFAEKEW